MFKRLIFAVPFIWQQLLCFISFGLVVPKPEETFPKNLGQEIGEEIRKSVEMTYSEFR